MAMVKMCSYPLSQHSLPYWKCVLSCFEDIPRIDTPGQESDMHHSSLSPSIRLNIYHLIACFTVHGRLPLNENKICRLCLQDSVNVLPAKLYTRKYLIMMETYIAHFHTSFYITSIQKLDFSLPYLHVLGTNHCVDTRREVFKRHRAIQYLLCPRDYSERVVASFVHQIKSE